LKSRLLVTLRYLLLLAVGLGLLWFAFKDQNFSELLSKIYGANPYWLGLSILLAIMAFMSRAVRWVLLMEPLGKKPGVLNAFYALLIGYLANLGLPRAGEITRCAVLSKSEDMKFNSLIGTVIIERIIDLLMLLFTMTLVAILEYDLLWGFLRDKILIPISSKLTFIYNPFVIVGLILFVVVLFFINRKSEKTGESKIRTKIRQIIHEIGNGFKSVMRMKRTGWFVFHTLLIWTIYFLMTWVCFFCLESTSDLDAKAGLFILVAGGLGMSAPVQGGIGAYHVIVSEGLQLFNISKIDGLTYATLVHTSQTLLVIVLGSLSLIMVFLTKKKIKNDVGKIS
jgi:glycosyltransferase 2 family protein